MRSGVRRVVLLFAVAGMGAATGAQPAPRNPYLVRTFIEDGKQIDEIIVPGKPPDIRMEEVSDPVPNPSMGINVLTNVPAFTWSYGCSTTSAAMMMGYYDNNLYPSMYTGPTNGGVCPLNNETYWGHTHWPSVTCGECPLSATKNGLDGRGTRGHVDDYWIDYNNAGPDPWIANGWTEHTQGDCTGDFMGTNQSDVSNVDGGTTFYYWGDGSPIYDYTGSEPTSRDGCHGVKLFVESRGYTVEANGNFSQYSYPNSVKTTITQGFTFAQFKTEIDNWRPVLIHVVGHTILGYGYDDATNTVYIKDTWDNSSHTMTWAGSYGGKLQYGVTVLQMTVPLPVRVSGLTAQTEGGQVLVRWETATEVGTLGFVILRASHPGGPYERVSERVIAATAQPGRAGRYEFIDRDARPGRVHYYRIAEVGEDGAVRELPDTVELVPPASPLYDLLPDGVRMLLAS